MSRYAAAHANPRGAGDARPTAMQIVNDEGLIGKLTDKVMLITGGSAGIGAETARAFHAMGAKLFLTVRELEKGQKVVEAILADDPSNHAEIILIKMELGSLDCVRAGAKDLLGKTDKLNVLVNNACVMATPESRTKDGFESQFGTNHLAHFLLFQLLKPTLLASSTRAFQSRVVVVSSLAHRCSSVRFDDYNLDEPTSYSPWTAYEQSKSCVIHFANEIERRYGSQGLHATPLHPGAFQSALQFRVDASVWEVPELKAVEKSPAQRAATTVYAALSRDGEGKGGVFLSSCAVMGPYRGKPPTGPEDDDFKHEGYAPCVYDAVSEGRLWKDSLRMVGLEDD